MKRRWSAWFLGLLGMTTGCDTPATSASPIAEASGASTPEATASATPAPITAPTAPSPPSDPYAPVPVNRMRFPPPPDLFYDGCRVRGSASGPVNTERPDRAFFTDPRMNKGEKTGRLFYEWFIGQNPHDPHIPVRHAWFICWSTLEEGDRAQRLYNRTGYTIHEVTTDGKRILVHHSADVGNAEKVDAYRWKGDATGQGRFVLEGATPANAIPKKPTPFEDERNRGYSLLSQKKYDEAIATFKKALALKPNDAATHFAIATAWEESGLFRSSEPFQNAIAAYGKAIAADPKRAAAYRQRARLSVFLKQYDSAIADMTKLITMTPKDWEGYVARSRAYAGKGDYARAVADVQKASQIGPREDEPWIRMALYQYRAGKYEAAINAGRKALSIDDSETEVRITIACAYARMGKADMALKVYEEAKNNGVGSSERQAGIRELKRVLKSGNPTPAVRTAVQKLLDEFVGPEQLEGLGDDEDVGGL